MKKRYTEAQIAFALRQAASGTPVSEITRKMGVIELTFYRWKKQYANMDVSEIRRFKQLEDENHTIVEKHNSARSLSASSSTAYLSFLLRCLRCPSRSI
jgi:putative transposase